MMHVSPHSPRCYHVTGVNIMVGSRCHVVITTPEAPAEGTDINEAEMEMDTRVDAVENTDAGSDVDIYMVDAETASPSGALMAATSWW